ncbi:MAG: glycosyltransferase [Planctomycetaceae bacterium]|jgi:UDP:flavonoid glycosyltransferase YjiC (YdhE family)|nr:glycosyltransferase [Planctomycetaceae bacterium]
MNTELQIDFVAPPLAGHLFPQLQLARYLKTQGFNNLRFFSCPAMQNAVESCGIGFTAILADKENEVMALSHTEHQMNSLRGRLKSITGMLRIAQQMYDELQNEWTVNRPDLAVIDFCSPFAGFAAEDIGVRWWTAMPCLSFLEAKTSAPHFCGSLQPSNSFAGKVRNAVFRQIVRTFKYAAVALFGKEFRKFGFKRLYYPDGSEGYFSPEIILALGLRELEFEPEFPAKLHWLGPCPESPPAERPPLHYEADKRYVLISLGTQIPWVREKAEALFRSVAAECPDLTFHFTRGKVTESASVTESTRNLLFVNFVPYTAESLRHYDVIINHCGSGVMYASIAAGVPQLLYPQDFDQFDNAARVVYHGLGLRTTGKVRDIVRKLNILSGEERYRSKAAEFQQIARSYNPGETFLKLLEGCF